MSLTFICDKLLIPLQLQSTSESLQTQLDNAEAKLKIKEDEYTTELESTLIRLEEEQQRYVK